MTRSKTLVFALIVMLPFVIGCASGGMKKPKVFVDKQNNIPADIPSQFPDRYERFINGQERKEFKKLLTDEERQIFIDKFWTDRDPDPATPENEEKQRIDQRIDDIANEPFVSTPGMFGLSFQTNGGFRGDMAHVYLLHGEPDAMDTLEGSSFVNLVLWIYGNLENGGIRYAFLFYQRGEGSFRLFSQDSYQLDHCGAINEIMLHKEFLSFGGGNQACPPNVEDVFLEIRTASGKGGNLDGYIFAWSLFNFSQDGSASQGKALGPPKPASEISKQSNARVTGEASKLVGTAGTDYILASCDECNSFIPAELSMGERFTVSGLWKNFDWTVKEEYLELSLKYRIILENRNTGKPIILEGLAVREVKRSLLEKSPEGILVVDLLELEQVAAIPLGTYQVSIYIKNTMTKKYNAWSESFTK